MLVDAMLEELVKVSEFLSKKGYAPATNGNFSARIDDKSLVIGGAKKDKSAFTKHDVVICDFQGNLLSGDSNACTTTYLHGLIYQLSPYTNCILQSHSKAIQVLSRLNQKQQKMILQDDCTILIFENNALLADNIKLHWQALNQARAFIVQGNGLYSWGLTVLDAKCQMEKIEFLADCELAYQLINQ